MEGVSLQQRTRARIARRFFSPIWALPMVKISARKQCVTWHFAWLAIDLSISAIPFLCSFVLGSPDRRIRMNTGITISSCTVSHYSRSDNRWSIIRPWTGSQSETTHITWNRSSFFVEYSIIEMDLTSQSLLLKWFLVFLSNLITSSWKRCGEKPKFIASTPLPSPSVHPISV